jgi:hypothetical protein
MYIYDIYKYSWRSDDKLEANSHIYSKKKQIRWDFFHINEISILLFFIEILQKSWLWKLSSRKTFEDSFV